MLKKVISYLYHKFVNPYDAGGTLMPLEKYIEWCNEVYRLRPYYEIKTHEQFSYFTKIAYLNVKAKNEKIK